MVASRLKALARPPGSSVRPDEQLGVCTLFQRSFAALENIRVRARRQSNPLSTAYMGQPFSAIADAQAHGPLATLYIINAVSILDEGLEHVMSVYASPSECRRNDSLGKRIMFLERYCVLANASLMRQFKDLRNSFAHEVGSYGTWQDLWMVLEGVEREIRHLHGLERLQATQPPRVDEHRN